MSYALLLISHILFLIGLSLSLTTATTPSQVIAVGLMLIGYFLATFVLTSRL